MEDNLINNELNLDLLGRPILKYYDGDELIAALEQYLSGNEL